MLATEKLEVALQEALLANEKLTAEVATLKKNILATGMCVPVFLSCLLADVFFLQPLRRWLQLKLSR